jgi:hypothetical protein
MRWYCLLFFFILFSFNSFGQSDREWGIEARTKLGFLAAHRGVMGHLPSDPAFAGELTWFMHPKGRKQWHSACGYPTTGVTLFGGSVGNNEILGTFWGAYSFIEFPFLKLGNYAFSGKLGSGLAYGSKYFSYEDNPKNVAMSTPLNALICIGVKSRYQFGRNSLTLSLDMTHFSNGAFKVPNLGVNLPYVSLGYARMIRLKQMDTVKVANVLPFKKWLFNLTGIISAKEIFPTGGKKYPVYALTGSARWFSKPKVGMEFGFDVISKQAITGYRPEIPKSQWDIVQAGVFAAYLLPLDQFHFGFGMGVYLKDKYQPEDALYHRIAMRYYFQNGINLNIGLKSHWARADYVEWGIGYTFNFKDR